MQLTRGQNTALQATTLRFTATSGTPLNVSALVVDTSLQALSSDTFVFYNQPHTYGVRLGEGSVDVDLDAVLPDAHAVLCIVSVDPLAADTAFSSVTTSLTDPTGAPVAHFNIDCRAAETAVICWELYRRAGTWKVRAVGQGYADGLVGLITRHGVDVDDPTPELEAASPGEYGPIEPLDPHHIVERFTMIMEDAARTTAALIAARQFAEARLDQELTTMVADPATRNGPHVVDARARAQHRHDTLVAESNARYTSDTSHLEVELRAISPRLPRSVADWTAPAWTTGTAVDKESTGIRIGEVSAPHCGTLRIPVVLLAPLHRPLHIIGADSAETSAVVTALVLRILATNPSIVLDVVDLASSLRTLSIGLAHRNGITITAPDQIDAYFENASSTAELALLDLADPHAVSPEPRLIVLNHFPYGYDQRHLPYIAFLSEHGPALGLSTIVVTDDPTSLSVIDDARPGGSYTVPARDYEDWHDPWTSNTWTFTPDRTPSDAHQLARVLEQITAR
ncbi:tellurium resistance protein [Rhodococcus hoagii]|nr:tellurium resistance protein [Prescottella equi]NKW46131.1 tellurium resistance protein [Prescottella equi]